jgi:hypothetical protein
LDGLLPIDIRKIAWEQIYKYDSAELHKEKIVNVNKEKDGILLLQRIMKNHKDKESYSRSRIL